MCHILFIQSLLPSPPLLLLLFVFLVCLPQEGMKPHYTSIGIPGRCLTATKVLNRPQSFCLNTKFAQMSGLRALSPACQEHSRIVDVPCLLRAIPFLSPEDVV